MTHHLRRDMEKLEKLLLHLAAQVEDAVRMSMTALFEQRADLAERIIGGDTEIDRREVEVEEECLKVLALHQPVAADLRFLTACLKINNDLERIGDLACNIAKRVRTLAGMAHIPVPAPFRDMTEITLEMVRRSIDAFVKADRDSAEYVLARDDDVDLLNKRIITDLQRILRDDHAEGNGAVEYYSVSKHLERIADHATNIAEDVVYMVSGDIIRHRGRPAAER